MHLRTSTVRRGDKTYAYTQLVESYRRADGMPAHRVVASLGALSPLLVENIRVALVAARTGGVAVLPEALVGAGRARIEANLRYLDLALLRRVWQALQLPELLEDLLPPSEAAVPLAEIVSALVLHRCVAPGSKLSAQRWYPTTALPELQGIPPKQFNNTRVHRVLEALEAVEGPLQERLPSQLRSLDGVFVSLFADLTDTWFVGRGPALAQKGRDKEGIYRRRIGIALLCDQRGYPLRWKTLPGRYHDPSALAELAGEVARLPWVGETPVVMDRAMGRAGSIELLVASGLRFLTALPVDEFSSYTQRIPWSSFADLPRAGREALADRSEVVAVAERAGLRRVRDDRYVLDLGVFQKGDGLPVPAPARPPVAAGSSRAVTAMQLAHALHAFPADSLDKLALRFAISKGRVHDHLKLLKFIPSLQTRILAGEADGATLKSLLALTSLASDAQEAAFDGLLQTGRPADPLRAYGEDVPPPPTVRGVLHFNPDRFLEQRRGAAEQLKEVDAFVVDLNRRLGSRRCLRTDSSVIGELETFLRLKKLLEIFTVALTTEGGHRRIAASRNPHAWALRRRFDGFNVFLAHRDLPLGDGEIVDLYFAKDAVEKDFQTIKSALELHPVRHRTDPKVRAHVTLCMLALLLERSLERRLASAGAPQTAIAAIEVLQTCHLNRFEGDADLYSVTTANPAQRALLAALGMTDLAEDTHIHQTLTPR